MSIFSMLLYVELEEILRASVWLVSCDVVNHCMSSACKAKMNPQY